MRKVGLFESVDHNDKEGLFGKAIAATKWLKILAIISIVPLLLIALLIIYIIANVDSLPYDLKNIVDDGGGAVLLVFFILLIIVQVLMVAYLNWIDKKLRKGLIPNFIIAYIIILFNIYNLARNVSNNVDWYYILTFVAIIIFRLYLWFLIITNTKKTRGLSKFS